MSEERGDEKRERVCCLLVLAVEGQKGKGIEGWVKGGQPGIIGPSAEAAECGSVCTASACMGET